METHLAQCYKGTHDGIEAEAVLRKCVHCGFCTATCPTYQLLGNELDGPRGRIYLIKQVLEGAPVTRDTQIHLDLCLTCRNCESTCPSGVQYGKLVDIGRKLVEGKVKRPLKERATRWLLKEGLTSKSFGRAFKFGRMMRPLLPATLKAKVPEHAPTALAHVWPKRTHARKVLMPLGCVQPAMLPNINSATARVLDACGFEVLRGEHSTGCCGALKTHLNDFEGGLQAVRRNVDAWWPWVESGEVQYIVMNASGCSVMVKDYGHLLKHESGYAQRAQRISELARDITELMPQLMPKLKEQIKLLNRHSVIFHSPCTLQHGQQVRGVVETQLSELGFDVQLASAESHLCCGSAGAYSVLNPEISKKLRDRKLSYLLKQQTPGAIISANIGCIQHLQSGTQVPVKHWIEVVDEALR